MTEIKVEIDDQRLPMNDNCPTIVPPKNDVFFYVRKCADNPNHFEVRNLEGHPLNWFGEVSYFAHRSCSAVFATEGDAVNWARSLGFKYEWNRPYSCHECGVEVPSIAINGKHYTCCPACYDKDGEYTLRGE